jgi:1,6-anhydro-N-acetylmuramate kinase
MTGTSIDALDASLVEIEGHGLAMRAYPLRSITRALGDLVPRLRALAEQRPMTAGEISTLTLDFARLHASTILELLGGGKADLVCVHGQTVFHQPPRSWQLMQPAPIAAAVGCPVVYDLRQADLAAGGQGAPITPIADWVLFGDLPKSVAVVNLGGFCNVTMLKEPGMGLVPSPGSTFYTPSGTYSGQIRGVVARADRDLQSELDSIIAKDVCACNQLLDAVAREALGKPYDTDGASALKGQPDKAAADQLTAILLRQSGSGRSMGTGDELGEWIQGHRKALRPEDLAATACGCIGAVIGDQITSDELVLAGGGVRNRALVRAIGESCERPVTSTSEYGVPTEYREAVCFAILGALCQDRVPITLPQVTGVKKAPFSGAWVYP